MRAELRNQYIVDTLLEMTSADRFRAIKTALDTDDSETLRAIHAAPNIVRADLADDRTLASVRRTWLEKHDEEAAQELAEVETLLGELSFDIRNIHHALSEPLADMPPATAEEGAGSEAA